MTVHITAFEVGEEGIEYFAKNAGCGHVHDVGDDPAAYFLSGQAGNWAGRWWGSGLEHLGLLAGAEVDEQTAKIVFAYMADPRAASEALAAVDAHVEAEGLSPSEAEGLRGEVLAQFRLGGKPYRYKSVDERVAARLKKEGVSEESDPERVREIRLEEAGKSQPKARAFYDITFSPAKSSSIFFAGLLAAGRGDEAELMRRLHSEAVEEALAYLQEQAGYARAGHHGKAPEGRASVGRWERGDEWIAALWDHQTSRAGEPQLHTHATVLNKVRNVLPDGTVKWRALDGSQLYKARKSAAAIYERSFEQRMEAHFAVAYGMRPDGKAREIIGISEEERAALSSRSAKISELMDRWVEEYKARHGGREPSAYTRTVMQQDAAAQTRARKEVIESSSELLRRWERMVGQRLKTSLAGMLERAEAAAISARAAGDAQRWEEHVVIGQALAQVQKEHATWTRADLMFAINSVLPDRLGPSVLAKAGYTTALLERLADQALSGAYGTVLVRGMDLLDVPPELMRSDGRSVYRAGADERYALVAHLTAEQKVEARAKAHGAKALPAEAAAAIAAEMAASGRPLSEDQAAVVSSVLCGGRHIDVVVGPAGTGKSVAQGAIAKAWEAAGGRVIGLATSSKAAQVLQGEGLQITFNTTLFFHRAQGKGPWNEVALAQLRPGDLVILDEAGMTETDDVVRIAEMCEQAGAKLVLCGDHSQLTAVHAGGLFRQLVFAGLGVELETVRRFRDQDGQVRQWEAKASLGLRDGQVHALQPYLDRGRFRSGTIEEMTDEIRRLYVSDVLRGVRSAVMAATAEQAASISAAIRADLVALGRVEAEGVDLADGTIAGRGDLVQTRDNENQLKDSAGMPVFNRFLYRVLARHDDGALTVRRVVGRDEAGAEKLAGTVRLPAEYVAQHVELGYAGTIHSVQGETVECGYTLLDSSSTREQLYVGMTRGWLENRGFVALDVGGRSGETPIDGATRPEEEMLPVLAAALGRIGAQQSASDVLVGDLEWSESLGAHAPIWADLVEQHQKAKHQAMLRESLGEEVFERLEAEDASTVYRQLWAAELAGHDTARLISETTGRDFVDVESIPAVLYARINRQMDRRAPERPPAGASWLERTPADMAGPLGEHVRARAEVMDARVAELGARAVEAPPQWALERLGPVPADPVERADWQRRAAAVEAYREQYGVDAPVTVIGPAPAPSMVTQYAAWRAAHQALGRTAVEEEMARASEAELRERVEIWQREQEWAPPDVAEELSRLDWERLELQETVARVAEEAERAAEPEQAEQLREQARVAQEELQRVAGYGQAVEVQHEQRQDWYARTAQLREEAQEALRELLRRKADTPEGSVPRPRTPEVEADRTPEREAEVEPSQQQREQEAFARFLDRQAEREQEIDPPADETPAPQTAPADVDVSQQQREQEAFARYLEWRERQAELGDRVMEELHQAQEQAAGRDQEPTVRERTERGESLEREEPVVTDRQAVEETVARLHSREHAHARLAEWVAAKEREQVQERQAEQVNREVHYARQAEQEQVIAQERDLSPTATLER